jgi:hypothetical protein
VEIWLDCQVTCKKVSILFGNQDGDQKRKGWRTVVFLKAAGPDVAWTYNNRLSIYGAYHRY